MNDIYHGLPEKHAVAIHAHSFVSFNRYALTLFLDKHFEESRCFARQIHCREDRWMQLNTTRVRPRDSEQAIDQCSKSIHLLEHASDSIAVLLTTAVLLKGNFAHAPN